MSRRFSLSVAIFALMLMASLVSYVAACPFCDAVSRTFTQDMEIKDMAVLAKLVKRPDDTKENAIKADTETFPKATFEIYHILKGEKHCKVGERVQAFYMGEAKVGTKFLLYGQDVTEDRWEESNVQLSDIAEAYILELTTFPKDPSERMVKMQKYLRVKDKVVNYDAMSEFAPVDVRDLVKVKHKFDLDAIRKTVADPKTESSLMALNYSLLGICGDKSDIPLFEERLSKGDDLQMKRLDALIGSYLMLTKEAGLEMIVKKILMPAFEKKDVPRVMAVHMALQYHGDDGHFIAKEKVAAVLSKYLDYPDRADIVILDLSRWKYWQSADRIMKLARETRDQDNPFIRELAIKYMVNYLKADLQSQKAKDFLVEMQRIDPESFRRATVSLEPVPRSPKANAGDGNVGKKLDLEEKPAAGKRVEQSTSTK